MGVSANDPLIADFQQALEDCRRLYRDSAEHCLRYHPQYVKRSRASFLELMDDLHRGLVVKIYLSTALVDHRWSARERVLAQCLLKHAWGRPLEGEALREAAEHLTEEVGKMTWYSLVRPFAEIDPLRECVAELETVVMRIANIVARADGVLAPSEERFLESLREELDRHLRPIALDHRDSHEHRQRESHAAVREMTRERRSGQDRRRPAAGSLKVPRTIEEEAAEPSPEVQLQQLLVELDSLIGLSGVKEEVRTLANLLKLQQQRQESGLPRTAVGLHMVFEGNPGTGKTTVARLVAQIFRAMGILAKGHLVETDRSGLVAEYAGQTGPKTNKCIDSALDGVLFIDEAYSLVAADGDDPYGREALQTLLKRMEDDRERLVVVLAGYPEPMRRLLMANPGLSSRFNRTLRFADYEPTELCRIFARLCKVNHFELTPPVRIRLLLGFAWAFEQRDAHFGNGRLVRNVFEGAIRHLANRVAHKAQVNHEALTQFEPEDIQIPGVPEELLAADTAAMKLNVVCPGCQQDRSMTAALMGRRVRCNGCQHVFLVEWGTPPGVREWLPE